MKSLLPVIALLLLLTTASAQGPYLTPFDFGLKALEHGRIDYAHTPPNILCGNFNSDCYPDILRFNGSNLELFLFSGQGYPARPTAQRSFNKPITSLCLEGDIWSRQRDLVVVLQDGSEQTFGYKNGILELRQDAPFGLALETAPRQINEFDFQIVWQSETYPFGFASCTAGDLDNDGIEELVSYWQEDSYSDTAWILIYKCTGDNQYELFMQGCFDPDIGTQSGVSQMLIGDIDQNGQNELILAYDKCYFWEFSAPGVYTSWRSNFVFPGYVGKCQITDVDQDGILEIAAITTNPEPQMQHTYLVEEFQQKSNPPDSTMSFATITWFTQSSDGTDIEVGDFDNDGAVDIVAGSGGFNFSYDRVETQYFRYDETSISPPNFREYWLNPGIPLSCVNPVIADLDGDGANELYAGGISPWGGSAFIWEATGLQTGFVAWLDTVNSPWNPDESSFGYVDGEACVAAVHIIPTVPPQSQLVLWAHSDSTYMFAWQSARADSTFYSEPLIYDTDGDGKKSIIVSDYIHRTITDWEQTSAGIGGEPDHSIPSTFQLHQNHPNPFNTTTTIPFSTGAGGDVSLVIYNTVGQPVFNRGFEGLLPGNHEVTWSPTILPSGIYLIRVKSGYRQQIKKALLLK